MPPPTVAFCTTCRGRAQHLEISLPRNLADNARYPNAKFIILDYNSDDHLIAYLQTHHAAELAAGRLVVYTYPEASIFRMAHAKNMAHRCGLLEGADILMNLDADNFTGPNFAEYVARQFEAEPNAFLFSKMMPGLLPRGISGRIAISSHAFLNSGGYNEKYETWGPDDKDFNARLTRLGYAAREIDPIYLADGVRHSDKMRFRAYPHVKNSTAYLGESGTVFEVDSDTTIANFGRFGEGIVYRNFDLFNQVFDPIVLGPLPTRVFGIGMHKTATTSLHTALKLLGVDSAHWKNAHWAKAIYEEMTALGRSETLERHYAVCDLPITLFYEELDRAYPNSKFILTTKNEQKWIQSVRDHWDRDYNKFRASWDKDPFTHRLHKIVYGQKGFDAELFAARFRRHNAEVLEYFRRRPLDLLVMDMDAGAGWAELCGFLRKPIPSTPYPRIDPVAKGNQ